MVLQEIRDHGQLIAQTLLVAKNEFYYITNGAKILSGKINVQDRKPGTITFLHSHFKAMSVLLMQIK